jgi:subtilase family serine protease
MRPQLSSKIGTALVLIATGIGARAETVQVGGPLRPGYCRPPLHVLIRPAATSVYYSPAQIRHAYGFDQVTATGAGQTIGIVDAYGSPTIQSDLQTFTNTFGLPPANLQVIGNARGTSSGWAQETSLDVEWAHAIAPGAKILLSVAKSARTSDLVTAIDAAVNKGATVVSMSWGGSEFSGETSYDSHFNKSGVTFTAASGDNGPGVEWPAVSQYVIGVGGTSLFLDSNGNRISGEAAWSGSGGGVSAVVPRPSFQSGWQSAANRAMPDVSYVADPNTGVLVVYKGSLYIFGGTSVGTPQWAALIALANSGAGSTLGNGSANTLLYKAAQGTVQGDGNYEINATYFWDILVRGADPSDGYDSFLGIGSPVGNNLVPHL